MRSRNISASSFNANSYNSCSPLRIFHLIMPGIGGVVLRRLESPCRLSYLEEKIGGQSSALSKIVLGMCGDLRFKKSIILQSSSTIFFDTDPMSIKKQFSDPGAPLNNCAGFIDCTNIKMERLGGRGSNQRANYSGHKRFQCFSYQTVTLPDGLVFSCKLPTTDVDTILQCTPIAIWTKFFLAAYLSTESSIVYTEIQLTCCVRICRLGTWTSRNT
jgi:hypothetical protein